VPRVISFIVLLAIVLLVGAVFFQVMAQFMVPLFLACVLLVVFEPLHRWMLGRIPGWPRTAALLTTVLILLLVLLPLISLGWNAYVELHGLLIQSTHGDTGQAILPPTTGTDGALPPAEEEKLAGKLKTVADDILEGITRITGLQINAPTAEKLIDRAASFGTALVIGVVQSTIGILVGMAIMVISLYYFLADGPAMIATAMHLSPLEPAYEKELLERFAQVSRAVVVATLLSAVVQGALAGIGYYFALPPGKPIFLLTVLTMVTAMVPFVGAAFMWALVCGWIYLYGDQIAADGTVIHDGDPLTAIVLAVYCTIVVSGIDNVIKPFILHGQSKLHPLLALLSILGGVQVLGPVGILVGPMLVSFLQALLNMLRKELDSFGGVEAVDAQLAEVVDTVDSVAGETAALAIAADDAARQKLADRRRATDAKSSSSTAKPTAGRGWKRKRGR
jgi:predicted PurR-regulated permease PerM